MTQQQVAATILAILAVCATLLLVAILIEKDFCKPQKVLMVGCVMLMYALFWIIFGQALITH